MTLVAAAEAALPALRQVAAGRRQEPVEYHQQQAAAAPPEAEALRGPAGEGAAPAGQLVAESVEPRSARGALVAAAVEQPAAAEVRRGAREARVRKT
jgi:hypothetical protein